MMVTAPAAIASKLACAPFSASDEQMITGVGRSAMILRRKEMPSMRGISISTISTSGQSFRILSMAKSGSAAVAMTSIPAAFSSACETTWRTSAESSTIITLMLSAMDQRSFR